MLLKAKDQSMFVVDKAVFSLNTLNLICEHNSAPNEKSFKDLLYETPIERILDNHNHTDYLYMCNMGYCIDDINLSMNEILGMIDKVMSNASKDINNISTLDESLTVSAIVNRYHAINDSGLHVLLERKVLDRLHKRFKEFCIEYDKVFGKRTRVGNIYYYLTAMKNLKPKSSKTTESIQKFISIRTLGDRDTEVKFNIGKSIIEDRSNNIEFIVVDSFDNFIVVKIKKNGKDVEEAANIKLKNDIDSYIISIMRVCKEALNSDSSDQAISMMNDEFSKFHTNIYRILRDE